MFRPAVEIAALDLKKRVPIKKQTGKSTRDVSAVTVLGRLF